MILAIPLRTRKLIYTLIYFIAQVKCIFADLFYKVTIFKPIENITNRTGT